MEIYYCSLTYVSIVLLYITDIDDENESTVQNQSTIVQTNVEKQDDDERDDNEDDNNDDIKQENDDKDDDNHDDNANDTDDDNDDDVIDKSKFKVMIFLMLINY